MKKVKEKKGIIVSEASLEEERDYMSNGKIKIYKVGKIYFYYQFDRVHPIFRYSKTYEILISRILKLPTILVDYIPF